MGALVPFVHGVEHFVGLVHDQYRCLGDHVQSRIGNDDRNLDDTVGVGIEAGHLHVQPDEIILVLRDAALAEYCVKWHCRTTAVSSMHGFTLAFLLALAFSIATRLWLARRHMRHVSAN